MKPYYLCYLLIDNKTKDKYPYVVDDANLMYENENFKYYFYGWTTSKKLMKRFKKTRRKDIFHYRTIMVSDEESEMFYIDNFLYQIHWNLLDANEILVYNEYQSVYDYSDELIYILFENINYFRSHIFSNKSKKILDTIDYFSPIDEMGIKVSSIHLFIVAFGFMINEKFIEDVNLDSDEFGCLPFK